jgi:histidine triad (HIT) family protein
MDCLFCQIAVGEIPATKVYEDASCIAFSDIHPQAPVHLLIIPRQHIASLDEVRETYRELLGHLMLVAAELAKQQKLSKGFRVVMNTGVDGGQTVNHLHLHLLGGRAMHWPPG